MSWNVRLFLTSKVRLHCDSWAFTPAGATVGLFLTSKVKLHCDVTDDRVGCSGSALFLTSKVRLHCDYQRFRKYGGLPTFS